MKNLEFPIISTKVEGLTKKFDLSQADQRKEYFLAKAGNEIAKIRDYMKDHTFIANMVGKKNAGKGTYSKIFGEIFGMDKIAHVSVGDCVRDIHANWSEFEKSEEFKDLKKHYRGFISFDEAVERLHGRSQSGLLPTEFILALLKYNIAKHEGKTLFIDGLPREMDQISYSLYFRDLINYREDPDMFILLDVAESIIEERIKYRVICPICKTPRNTKCLTTKNVGYDKEKEEFYLICDNSECTGCGTERMVPKEGDSLGIEPIRDRLAKDEDIMKMIFNIHGVPKILLRNNIPAAVANDNFDDYEITPGYSYEWDEANQKVITHESKWTIKDDNGIDSYSLLPHPVVIGMLKQMAEILG